MTTNITLLLATHDGARYLSEQLDSLRAQTHTSWQLQVLDDGSSDDTVAILERYAADDPRITVRTRPEAHGATPSYLTLLDRLVQHPVAAGAGTFGFVDQDDVWDADRLAVTIAALAAHEAAASMTGSPIGPVAVFTDARVVDAGCEPLAMSAVARYGYRVASDVSMPRLLVQNGASGNTMIGNRALAELATASSVDRSKLQAHDWWCAVLAATVGELIGLDRPTLDWRQHGENAAGAASTWHSREAVAKVTRLRSRTRQLLGPAAEQAVELQRLVGDRLTPTDAVAVEALAALARQGISRRRVVTCWRHGVRLAPLPRQLALMAGV